jgi:hypothetical protein
MCSFAKINRHNLKSRVNFWEKIAINYEIGLINYPVKIKNELSEITGIKLYIMCSFDNFLAISTSVSSEGKKLQSI